MSFKVNQVNPDFSDVGFFKLRKLLKSAWVTEGIHTEKLTSLLLDITGGRFGVFSPNGTLSLTMSLLATDLKPGKKVLIPDTTFFGTASSVILAGGIPIPVPVDSDYFLMDPNQLENFIDEDVTHLVPVDIFGYSYDRHKFLKIAEKFSLRIIDDAAQSIGVKYKDLKLGGITDATSFSFFADKTISMGEGGFIVTNDSNINNSLKLLRNQGRVNRGSFIHESIGFNFRITDIQALIGITQVNKLNTIIKNKQANALKYEEFLGENRNIRIVKAPSFSTHIPFRVVLQVKNLSETIFELERDNFLQTRRFFYPIHKQPGLVKWWNSHEITLPKIDSYKNSTHGYENGILLPVHTKLKKRDILEICKRINKVN